MLLTCDNNRNISKWMTLTSNYQRQWPCNYMTWLHEDVPHPPKQDQSNWPSVPHVNGKLAFKDLVITELLRKPPRLLGNHKEKLSLCLLNMLQDKSIPTWPAPSTKVYEWPSYSLDPSLWEVQVFGSHKNELKIHRCGSEKTSRLQPLYRQVRKLSAEGIQWLVCRWFVCLNSPYWSFAQNSP